MYFFGEWHKKSGAFPRREFTIISNADEVLRLVRSGNKHLVFSDIIKTYEELLTELKTADE